MKCPICGKDYPKGYASLHAHMMKAHMDEYRKKGCKLAAYGIDTKAKDQSAQPKPKDQPKGKPIKKKEPPEDFRPLDRTDPEELAAYNEGCRYYSGGCAYTTEECREMGWI